MKSLSLKLLFPLTISTNGNKEFQTLSKKFVARGVCEKLNHNIVEA